MANNPLNTELLDRAIIFAVKAHAGTERRGKGFPYIIHPMEAMEIVATMTTDQEVLAAAALHDTVEDTDVTIEELRLEFGDRIASLVAQESEERPEGMSDEESWHDRKRTAIDGALRNNEWTDDKGQRHQSTEIHLNNFILLDWGKENN